MTCFHIILNLVIYSVQLSDSRMEFHGNKNSENDNKTKQITIKGDLINIEEPLNINVIIEKDLEQAISGYGSTVSNPESITKGICKKEFKEELETNFKKIFISAMIVVEFHSEVGENSIDFYIQMRELCKSV